MKIKNPRFDYEDNVWYYQDNQLIYGTIGSVEISKNYNQITTYIMKGSGDQIQDLHVFATPNEYFNKCIKVFEKQNKHFKDYIGKKCDIVDLKFDFSAIYSDH